VFRKLLVVLLALIVVIGCALAALYYWHVYRPQQALFAERPNSLEVTAVGPTGLLIFGPIAAGDYERVFEPAFHEGIEEVILDSSGGDVEAALLIGKHIAARNVAIRVRKWCLSSCANYLFTAGARRVIAPGGIVGFHGNGEAAFSELGENFGVSDEDIAENLEEFTETKRQIDALIAEERAFFEAQGIAAEFFVLTQRPDKGIPGEEFAFLAPTPETFTRYGFDDVEGVQDVVELARLDTFGVAIAHR